MTMANDESQKALVLQEALADKLKAMEVIRSARVEAAFRAVPLHLFLPGVPLERVYSDDAVLTKLLNGQAVSSSSQPAMMAVMLEQLELAPGHSVLEIGAGTGYNAALMAHIVGESGRVVTVDLDEDIVERAREHLSLANFNNVRVICGDGALGSRDGAPYDRVVLTVGAGDIVPAWREQLEQDGRLLLPLEISGGMQLSVAFHQVDNHMESLSVRDCGFMMLRRAFARESMNTVQLGSDPGLSLTVDLSNVVDPGGAYQLLAGPHEDISFQIRATPWEAVLGALALWISLREPRLCILSAEGEIVDRGIVPCFMEWEGEWKRCWTIGILEGSSICVFTPSPSHGPPPEEAGGRLVVRSYGPDKSLAQRLMDHVASWDAAGRPSSTELRIQTTPLDNAYLPAADEVVVRKEWHRLVLD